MSTVTLMYDELNEFAWDFIETLRDESGEVSSILTGYDDGTTRFQSYGNGVLRFEELTDLGPMGEVSDVKPWESISLYYDEAGALQDRVEVKDDGVIEVKSYGNGVLRYVEMSDLAQDGSPSDARSWESFEKFFDASGQLEASFKVMDSGLNILTEYENGVRGHVTQTDLGENGEASDLKTWETIETFYDSNGVIEVNFKTMDDGTTHLMEYENGVRRMLTQTDLGSSGEASSVKNWETIETNYDSNGVIEAKFIQRDSGVTNLFEYENGVLRTRVDEDRGQFGEMSDARDWDSILTVYDENGQREAKETFYDNNDILAFFFEDGQTQLKLEYDGDDSATWLVRETLYDGDGQVSVVNTYDTLEDVPAEYGLGQWDMAY